MAVELAIWFHDAVYDPRAADNEEKSAELACKSLRQAGANQALSNSVRRLVLATKSHDGTLHPDAPLLVDIDLSVLGRPAEQFWEYEQGIRAEYAWVEQSIFAAKRAEMYGDLQKKVREQGPFTQLWQQTEVAGLRKNVQGFKLGPTFDTNFVGPVSK